MLEQILYDRPWISYNDTFVRSRIVLEYPKNLVFTLQFLTEHLGNEAYTRYPDVERFDVLSLQEVDWEEALIVLDRDHHVVVAPDPVKKLIGLDRRMRYRKAADHVFGPFLLFPLQLFRRLWLVWIAIALAYVFPLVSSRKQYLSLAT